MKKSIICLMACAVGLLATVQASAADGWHESANTVIAGQGSGWDYLSFDAGNHRLLIGHRSEGLQVFDVRTKALVGVIAGTAKASSNGAELIPEFDLGVSYNSNGTLTPFKLSTLEAQPAIQVADDLDSAHYDSVTKRLLVNVGAGKEGTDLVVLAVPSLKEIGRLSVPTKKPEHAASDGKGGMFLAAKDLNQILHLDMRTLMVTAAYPTPGCSNPTGLDFDRSSSRIFIGCRGVPEKPSFIVMDAANGRVVFKSEVGGGNDGVVWDPELKRVFAANGVNAVINIFEQKDANTYSQIEALGTRAGVRTLALDPKGQVLYGVAAEGTADYSKKVLTGVSPFYANTFFADTFRVLSYTPGGH